ncbi:MAG TPA: DASS family sodium-coupled anion symporter [Ignavibacteriaceae bacterium]|nr:DASS family sodium-coupled anion symporter [Ignavibacteriaceae bacterium]
MQEDKYTSNLENFEKYRRIGGFIAGPVIFFTIILISTPQGLIQNAKDLLPPDSSKEQILNLAFGAKITLALLCLMVIWWVSEAVPIPVTALLPGIVLPLFHVTGYYQDKIFQFTGKNILVNYANPIIFLFLSGFLLAAAMQKWKLDKRLTLFILTRGNIANNSKLVLLGMIFISAFLSMWISNTATTAMLLPLGAGIIVQSGGKIGESNFGKSLMLGIAWGASIGGVGTIIGTPPNGICVSILSTSGIRDINFVDWMKIGIPFVILFIPVLWIVLLKVFPPEIKNITGGKVLLVNERKELGHWSRAEKLTITAFVTVVLLWVSNPFWEFIFSKSLFENLSWFDVNIIALFGAFMLFLLPVNWIEQKFVLDWSDAKFVDWGTLLLFGGGIALSDGMFKTGLASWIATSIVALLGSPSTIVLMFALILMLDLLTEVTSNTAVVSMMIPIIISIAAGTGDDPVTLCVAATVAASMAFMLPVATPPNALVYGTGYIKIKDMIKGGFILDIIGWFFTAAIIYFIAHKLLGILNF